ncbi:hypothetical protein GJ654_19380 [Rhodoblastus acidophilus]|uniref:Uncharacterized protein n=1 Tax=Rhodoblastus acidophilus TaxID=1074 RepID=A0A6N8DRR1_RHOAC|nr:hypothetical protein [Rhodoblastus acidophilus]MCW2276432.1 hypothetical protein [Rhodoblastus acidophilus]MTV33149.1 hypothetical protein [Rhodoblastus acidophilus]
MDKLNFDLDESAVLRRFDRSSPDALLKSIAREIVNLRRAQAEIAVKMEVFASLQAAADRIVAAEAGARGASHPSRVVIEAAQSFHGSMGFYELEHDPDGQPFRWTGPDPRFSFEFFINRKTPARFVLRFGPLFTGGSPIGLLCFVDGEPAPVKLQAATTCFEAVGLLPPRRDAGGSVLSFVCPQMGSPASQGLDDARMLGLLFRRLTVESTPEQQALAPAAAPENVAPAAVPSPVPAPAPRGEFAAKKPVVKTGSEAQPAPTFQEISFKGPAR